MGVCVCLCALPTWSSASAGWGCSAGMCAWGAPPLLARVLGRVCFVSAPRLYPAIPGWGVQCGRAGWARVSAVFRPSSLGFWGVYVFVLVPRLHPFLWGPPVSWGCAGVVVGGFCPPPSPLMFNLFFLGGGVLSWLCGVGRCSLSRSWVSWCPSPPSNLTTDFTQIHTSYLNAPKIYPKECNVIRKLQILLPIETKRGTIPGSGLRQR